MNNVVNVFPNRWKDTLQAGRVSYGNTVQLVAARSIVHKSLKRSPAWTKPERVLKGLLWALRLASINERFNSRRKLKKKKKRKSHPWKMSITIEKDRMYTLCLFWTRNVRVYRGVPMDRGQSWTTSAHMQGRERSGIYTSIVCKRIFKTSSHLGDFLGGFWIFKVPF